MSNPKVALVTGASSGFGRLTALGLQQRGYRVFGTSRREQPATSTVEMLVLDVCSDASVQECVAHVLERAGQIDLLVNNAGILHVNLVEETPLEVAKALFETNFFGVARMTNAVLPSMRQRRQGRIINVGSLAGLVAVPAEAFYSAGKFALEGFSEALRIEVEPFGIKVSLIEPGFFRTELHANDSRTGSPISDYDQMRRTLQKAIKQKLENGGDPAEVAQLIVRVAEEHSPALRYRVGNDARWVPRLKQWLPESWFMRGVRRNFGL
jgi:NAD(P)-dependent dehydrogenase (short-subunit alcohol dehydrogenase family)